MPVVGLEDLFAGSASEYFVITIFLIAILIFLILQIRHFKRMEETLRKASHGRDLQKVLNSLERAGPTSVTKVDMKEVEERLQEICTRHARLEKLLVKLMNRLGPRQDEAFRSVGIQGVIEHRLQAKGFHAVNILSDTSELDEGEHKVAVEVLKGTVPYKGNVIVRNGRVVAEHLLSIYEAFP